MSESQRPWFCPKRPPDLVIGGDESPYLHRWSLLPSNPFFNVKLHRFMRSDDDVMHDHPWANVSVLLRGGYIEHVPYKTRVALDGHWIEYRAAPFSRMRRRDPKRPRWKNPWKRAAWVVFRRAAAAHSIELLSGEVWTLFLTGPRIREWGFHCPQGWRHWRDFLGMDAKGKPGGGCS